MDFGTASTAARVRIDSSGNLMVGKTSANASGTVGFEYNNGGQLAVTRDSNTVALFNINTNDGNIVDFRKDNALVGSIGVNSTKMYIGTGNANIRFRDDLSAILPTDSDGSNSDADLDLGYSTVRWRNLYLSGGVVFDAVAGNATSNTLDDFEEGTWTPVVNNATGYSAQFGRYVKVGKMVFINGNVNTSTTSAPGGAIGGLPFASSNTGNSAGNLSIGYYSNIAQHVVWIGGYVLNSSTNMYIVGNSAGHTGATIQRNGFNAFDGNSRVMFSGVYETDS
jgi:hypothetical protein